MVIGLQATQILNDFRMHQTFSDMSLMYGKVAIVVEVAVKFV